IGFSALLIAVNLASVTLYGTVEYAFSLLKIAAIVVFIVLGAYLVWSAPAASGIGFANYTAHDGFMPKGPWGTWVAVIVAIFSYMSIEAVAIAAGEARDPQHAVTRAFRSTVFRLVLFYLLTLSLMLAIVPWTAAGTDESPFVKVMAATHVPYAAGVINFVLLIAALSAMNSQLYVTTRMMFSLSRARLAPAVFGRLGTNGVPRAALWISTSGVAVAAVLVALAPDTAFTVMMAIAMFGALFTWLMIFVTHLRFRSQYRGPALAFRMWGHPFGSLLGAGLVAAILFTTAFTREFRMTMVVGVVFVVLLTLAYALHYRHEHAR
ncbi:amino acid permease, partial [Burkholderia sp.]